MNSTAISAIAALITLFSFNNITMHPLQNTSSSPPKFELYKLWKGFRAYSNHNLAKIGCHTLIIIETECSMFDQKIRKANISTKIQISPNSVTGLV